MAPSDMLPNSSPAVAFAVTKSVFQRAKLCMGRIGNSRNETTRPPSATSAQSLLDKFHGLKGGEKTAFFRAHKAELMEAEAAAPLRPRLEQPSASPAARRPVPSPTDTPEALLENFQGMTGAGKTAFFRANQSLLKLAAAVVSARESTGAAPAERNFSAALVAAPPMPAGADLLATFHTLSGTAKTAFFRANHLALKIAAAHETR